jgi:hypothetical protein
LRLDGLNSHYKFVKRIDESSRTRGKTEKFTLMGATTLQSMGYLFG